ncbi:DnaD domain protein [Salinicoccus sp. ID82-1]|uniref:DnaD domain protein n=1 Tax=Salinicoccus cyprini TaxID=2493691 RepID=A0A558AZ98_9STAP|nr:MULTISPECIES: DnaD domain protein [Salinicoccus]MCG1009112.1 DnaD domain protein [Salinicoccus sp. ID82-1]TVT29557.1 DnaD domain protein [Salinicoccus cyprini]
MIDDYIRYMNVPVNKVLLDNYGALDIDERAMIVIIRLVDIHQHSSQLPEFTSLSKGTTMSEGDISKVIQELMQKGLMEVETIRESGKYIERFNLEPLYSRLVQIFETREPAKPEPTEIRSLFEYVEGLYGRVISPNEFERINSWLEDSKYSPEAIRNAVDLAYQNQIKSLQYVERILGQTGREKTEARVERMPVRSWLEGEDVYDQ